MPAGGLIFRPEWFRFFDECPPLDEVAQSWDMTFKDSKDSDYVVGLVGGRVGADIYLIDRVKGQWDFTESCRQVTALRDRYPQTGAIFIEEAANGRAIINSLGRHVPGIIGVTPEGGKLARARAAQPLLEASNIWLPNPRPHGRTIPERAWVDDFLTSARSSLKALMTMTWTPSPNSSRAGLHPSSMTSARGEAHVAERARWRSIPVGSADLKEYRLAGPMVQATVSRCFASGTACHEEANTARAIAAPPQFPSLRAPPERMCGHRSGRPQVAASARPVEDSTTMRGRKNPPLEIIPVPDGTPLTFDIMAQAYLEDYVLQRYRTLTTARARVEHLREFFGGWPAETITADAVSAATNCTAATRRRSGHDQSRDVGAQPHVSVGDPARAAGAHAALSQPARREPAARRVL